MFAFIISRLLQAVPVLLVVGLIAYAMFTFVGDPVTIMLGQQLCSLLLRGLGLPAAEADIIAAQAAHDVLVNYFPTQQVPLDTRLAASLAAIPNGQPKTDGIAAGTAAAAHIIALRASDGAAPNTTYPGPVTISPAAWRSCM